jgi:radical SAM superfamily enzyme YgiQ (UPF0313 family)
MKVLLISFNQERFPDPVFPKGIYTIAKSIILEHQVFFVDLNLETMDEALQKINEINSEVIGISLRNADNVLYPAFKSYMPELIEFISNIRSSGFNGKIILGGSGFSIMPTEILRLTGSDYGIVGPGERIFPKLISQLENKEKPSPIINDFKSIYEEPFSCSDQLEDLNRKFNFEWYYKWGGCINITTKRGCPHNCIYCTYPIIEGKEYQLRKPKEVVNEIEYYVESMGIRHFFFTDSVFNDPIDYSCAIAEEILKRKLAIHWNGFFNPVNLNSKNLELFKNSGCDGIDLGVDSGSDLVLQNYGKNYDSKKIYQVVADCKSIEMPVLMSLLLGGPGETNQTLSETFEMLDKTDPIAALIFIGMRIYPQTPIYEISKREGLINAETDLTKACFYIAPQVKNFLLERVKQEAANHPSWVIPGLASKMNTEKALSAREAGIKGALWTQFAKSKQLVR